MYLASKLNRYEMWRKQHESELPLAEPIPASPSPTSASTEPALHHADPLDAEDGRLEEHANLHHVRYPRHVVFFWMLVVTLPIGLWVALGEPIFNLIGGVANIIGAAKGFNFGKTKLPIVAVMLLFATAGYAADEPSPPRPPSPVIQPAQSHPTFSIEMQKRVADATLLIVSNRGSGTATVIAKLPDSALVLTAYHVVENSSGFALIGFHYADSGSGGYLIQLSHHVEIVASLPHSDLALLRAVPAAGASFPEPIAICPSGKTAAKTGDSVFNIGCSRGESPTIDFTTIRSKSSHSHLAGQFWYLNHSSIGGRSGGALINQEGQLIGVCYGLDGNGHAVYQSPAEIHRLLDEAGYSHLHLGQAPNKPLEWNDLIQIAARLLLGFLVVRLVIRPSNAPEEYRANVPLMLVFLGTPALIRGIYVHVAPNIPDFLGYIVLALPFCIHIIVLQHMMIEVNQPLGLLPLLGLPLVHFFQTSPVAAQAVAFAYYALLAVEAVAGCGTKLPTNPAATQPPTPTHV